MKGLRRFVNSPIHNTDKAKIRLLDYILKYQDDFQNPKLDSTKVYKKIFPDKVNDSNRMAVLQSGLLALSKDYLAFKEYKRDKKLKEKMLIQALGKRNIYDAFEKQTKKSIKALMGEKSKEASSYSNLFDLHNTYYSHPETLRVNPNSESPIWAIKNLDLFYTLTRIRYTCGQYHKKRLKNKYEYNEDIEESVISLAKIYQTENITISIYLDIINLLKNGYEDSLYTRIKENFFTNYKDMEYIDQKSIHSYLINIKNNAVVTKSKAGEVREKNIEMFKLYKFGIENEIVVYNKQITPMAFRNIASLSGSCGFLEWGKEFVETNKAFLPKKERDNIVGLSLAYIYFNNKEYDRAHELLIDVDKWMAKYIWSGRSLRLRCYYEKFNDGELDQGFVKARIVAFKRFVQKDVELSNTKKDSYLNFSKILIKIVRLKFNIKTTYGLKVKDEKQKILIELEETNPLSLKAWLLKIITEM